jgi:hypothetical protein
MPLPIAADCARHLWLAFTRPKLFQSVVELIDANYR